tara:strand:+ start:187 stop:345 length:159 start_codon:yes stop_codon:yes gene_type:complete
LAIIDEKEAQERHALFAVYADMSGADENRVAAQSPIVQIPTSNNNGVLTQRL